MKCLCDRTRLFTLVVAVVIAGGAPYGVSAGEIVRVRPEDFEICVSSVGEQTTNTSAAAELKTHLDLIFGANVPVSARTGHVGRFVFSVEGDMSLPPEEARYRVHPGGVSFAGGPCGGVEHAVHMFLEDELGVRWPKTGDIAFEPRRELAVETGTRRWSAAFRLRSIRQITLFGGPDCSVWKRRMREGFHNPPRFGHAFTKYWAKYSKSHPEWFARRSDGLRIPAGAPATAVDDPALVGGKAAKRIAMCVSNDSLVDHVIDEWRRSGMPEYINACENDANALNVCTCERCRALDPPEPPGTPDWCPYWRSDRYVDFVRRILERARRLRPDVKAGFYAYNAAQQPPRRFRLPEGAVVGLVPTLFDMPSQEAFVAGWKKAGMKEFIYRPNRHYYYDLPHLPLGCEKHYFEEMVFYARAGAVGFSYDSKAPTGEFEWIRDYILAKGMQDPARPFEHWEDHYCEAFGAAASSVKAYFRHWREQVWERRIEKDIPALASWKPGFRFDRGLLANIGRYYSMEDFDASGRHLDDALARAGVRTDVRRRVEALRAAHERARRFVSDAMRTGRVSVKAEPSAGATPVAKTLFGIFIEDVNHAADGLMAEAYSPLKPAFKGRPNGIRKDLGEAIAALKPGFLRFPGGCAAQGRTFEEAYDWKATLRPPAERPVVSNLWGYVQNFRLGFYEYFQFAEDIGAEPVPVLPAGMTCHHFSKPQRLRTMEEMAAVAEDACDLVEFANGGVDTKWGVVRARMGHPAPFGMKYLAIGNEDIGTNYVMRYRAIAAEMKRKYPKIRLVACAHSALKENASWRLARRELSGGLADILDEHFYFSPEWLGRNTGRFNRYPRLPKLAVFEYACHEKGRGNTLDAALCEAAFMCVLERNADLVEMAAYAPLLGKRGASQWKPNLIWFTDGKVELTPNYEAQRFFAENRLDSVVKSSAASSDGFVHVCGWKGGELSLVCVNLLDIPREVEFEADGRQGGYMLPPKSYKRFVLKHPPTFEKRKGM